MMNENYDHQELAAVFASEEGVRQGSVEGPYLFMLTVASLLARLDFPVLTYMDDVYILVDQASELEAVIKDVTHALSKGHFVVNCAKCAIISVSPIPNVYPFPTVNSPSMVLGAVVGNLHSCETCPVKVLRPVRAWRGGRRR